LGKEYRSLSSSLCNFLHSPITSSLLGPNNLLNTLSNGILWEDYMSLALFLILHLTEYFVSKNEHLNFLNCILDAYIKMKQILLGKNLMQLLFCRRLETKVYSFSHWWLELLRNVTS